jgi:hypothetical protein
MHVAVGAQKAMVGPQVGAGAWQMPAVQTPLWHWFAPVHGMPPIPFSWQRSCARSQYSCVAQNASLEHASGVPTMHRPATHWEPGAQTTPHAPQFCVFVWIGVSQAFARLPSQFAKPIGHTTV